jgi:hypothetical protein
MIKKLFDKLFSGDNREAGPEASASVTYQELEIRPAPVKESNGWRVQGTIVKGSGEDAREHVFIRADACMDRESAVALTVRKARQLIDEQGEKLFD